MKYIDERGMQCGRINKKITEFTRERDLAKFHTPDNLAKSISIESAELLECYQWNSECDVEEVKEELADVLTYSLMMCNKLDLDFEQLIVDKLEKSRMKYPIEKCKGKSDKYDKL